ncbi:hypothetical protein CPB86DRAFT_756192 [Serendipita vermifera]|nr:hypothetical protein CPB86DRAFT_756192 [Serendipita vermifera]
MRTSTSLGGRRINVSFLLVGILALTSQVSCQPSKRTNNDVDARAVQDFNVNAADIFPAPHNKRLVGGLVSTLLNAVLPGSETTTTQQSTAGAGTSTQAPAPATSPTTGQNQQTSAGSSPTTAGNSPASSPGATNQPANPGATSDVASNTQGSGNASSPSKNGGGGGQSSVSAAGTSTATGSASRFITDRLGNTVAVTGTEPITLTYLTTLPNGVVSTVTEIVTPTSADATNGNGVNNGLSSGKIAAVVATLVTVFLVVFAIAMVLLMLRKRRRAIQLTRSRPTSASSFGSASDEFAYDSRRNSRAALAPMTSTSSFKTAPAYVDGAKLDFPLPPVPGVPEASTSNKRPLSGVSDGTFDFGFKEQQMSRASIIEERNFYRKIGNYPAAGTYTPFAVAPSSEMGHGDEPSFSPTDLEAALERGRTAGKVTYEEDRRSRTSELYGTCFFSCSEFATVSLN